VNEPADFFVSDPPSCEPMAAPRVLVVGGPDALEATVRRVAAVETLGGAPALRGVASSVEVEVCDAGNVRLVAARVRPFALVLSQEVYGFDPDRLGALARELDAELVVLKVARVSPGFLEQALRSALRHALRRYRSTVASGPVRK
jgi:hypothetical protein